MKFGVFLLIALLSPCFYAAFPCARAESAETARTDAEAATRAGTEQSAAQTRGPRWEALIARLAADGLERERMEQLFSELNLPWSPVFTALKLQELYGPRLGARARVRAEPESRPLPPDGYLPPAASGYGGAQSLLREQAALLAQVHARYGVPPSLIAAVLLLESDMGHELGNRPAFYALACMAATRTLDDALAGLENCAVRPASAREMEKVVREKSAWAYQELRALIRYGEAGGVDIVRLPGSVYGAVGLCQFMPGNIEAYGVDSTGKGVVDLFSLPDAAHSVGKFLREHGFGKTLPIRKQLEVLRRYNQSDSYTRLALGVSLQLEGKPVPPELGVFSAGGMRGGARKAWWPKARPGYRLPALKTYVLQPPGGPRR